MHLAIVLPAGNKKQTHRIHGTGIFTVRHFPLNGELPFFTVHVGKYSIHGSYGKQKTCQTKTGEKPIHSYKDQVFRSFGMLTLKETKTEHIHETNKGISCQSRDGFPWDDGGIFCLHEWWIFMAN